MEKKSTGKIRSIRVKILVPAAIVIAVVILFMGISSYMSINSGMVEMGIEEAQMAAVAATNVIDGDLLYAVAPGNEDSEEYQTILEALRKIQKSYDIKYLYTLYADGGMVYYGVDTDESEDQMDIGDEFEVSYEELEGVFEGEPYVEGEIDYGEDEDLISVYRPIEDSKGEVVGVLGCDYDAAGVVKRLHNSIIHTIVVMIISIAAVLILLGIIVGNIMNSLNIVSSKVAELVNSDGDLTKKIEVHTGDELEIIANNVNTVLGHICDQANIAKEVADGNMTVKVSAKSENDILGNALKQLVERNRETLRGIDDAAKQAKNGAAQMADASEALAQGSTEQAGALEEITASINGVAEKTGQNAHDASEAKALINQAVEQVKIGNEHMTEMMKAMKDINQSAEDIFKINKVIDDIAFQTNILALNASVEAARAGVHGKGFAVVAEEVRNLAGKSAKASKETSVLIEESMKKTKAGSQIADETGAALGAVTEVIAKSGKMIESIAQASSEQTEAVSQIDQAVEQVAKVVQTNSSTSQQCAASSAELSQQMERVDKMLSVYRL